MSKQKNRGVPLEEAIRIAEARLAVLYPAEGPDEVIIERDYVIEQKRFWILPYNTRGMVEAEKQALHVDEGVIIPGNAGWGIPPAPLCVMKRSGRCRRMGMITLIRFVRGTLKPFQAPKC